MDELNPLREVYRGIPGPSAGETGDARSRLLTAIDDPQSRAARRPAGAGGMAILGRLARPRVWMPAGAAAAVTAIVITMSLVTASGPKPSQSSRPSSAAQVLDEAAAAAARQPSGNGNFFALKAEQMVVGETQRSLGTATYWMDRQGSAWEKSAGGPDPNGINPTSLQYTWEQVQQLPLAPRQLLARFAGHLSGRLAELSELDEIGDLLGGYPASPALRSALYRAAALLPGLELVPSTHDPLGRAAAAVYGPPYPDPSGGAVGRALFFDPATGALLSYGIVLTQHYVPGMPYCPDGAVPNVELADGYVNSLGQLPPPLPATAGSATSPFALPGCHVTGTPASPSPRASSPGPAPSYPPSPSPELTPSPVPAQTPSSAPASSSQTPRPASPSPTAAASMPASR